MVAVVPKLMQAVSGVRQPEPMMSHALSLDAATNGSPSGRPVCSAAAAVITPRCSVGGTTSGSFSLSMGNRRHFRSRLPAQSDFFTSKGMVPVMLPVESRNSPVRRWVKYPERKSTLCVRCQISGWFC